MIYLKNTSTGQYVRCITGEAVDYTDSRLDAFDFDKDPTPEEKKTFLDWILGAGEKAPVEFVRESDGNPQSSPIVSRHACPSARRSSTKSSE